jgi:hypothetical protein
LSHGVGSADLFFLNHYTSSYASVPDDANATVGWFQDMHVNITSFRNGVAIGPLADSHWLRVVPFGIRKLVNWVYQVCTC